jgi:UDP-N-acetylglucosamine 1-carboxyvinyltransferase
LHYLEIEGGTPLKGSVNISGAKNAALPLIAMTLLAKNSISISNVPNVADVNTFLSLLKILGASYDFEKNTLFIDTLKVNDTVACYDIVRTMRASILVLGPLLARFGKCSVSLPGGCAIGERPVDLHLSALEKMGATINIKNGYIEATAQNGLHGALIVFDKITVTGTENIIMAAALAKGRTKIINAAKEPEVVELCEILKSSGVEITGIGTNEIEVVGSDRELLDIVDFDVIPDRIEAGTYLCAGAITNSKITINRVDASHLSSIIDKLQNMGYNLECKDSSITIHPSNNINPTEIITTEYPGFPTDMQAQFMALATQANGVSTIEERLFENRFMHVSELKRLGADIHLNGHVSTIKGKKELYGADVMATDLRASSALVLCALVAKDITKVHRIYHLDRGYESLESKLEILGAKIRRLKE